MQAVDDNRNWAKQLHRLQQWIRVEVGAKGERLQERRRKFSEVAVALREEIKVIIVQRAHQPLALFDGRLQFIGGLVRYAVDYFAVERFFSNPVIAPIKKQPAQNLPLYELKITLRGSKPAIWRRVQVPGSINLNRLHDVFQVVMGWTDSHLHQFVDAPIVYSVPSGDDYPGEERLDERRFRLADVARHEKASFIYEYDFGDSWTHEVVVEKILPADPKKKYAVCPDGKNACPPEDCGGIWGYYELLKAVKNPKHKEHQEMLDWLGGPFDPGHFDFQKINAELRGLGNLARPSPFSTH